MPTASAFFQGAAAGSGWLHGLKVVAVAVVALAIQSMVRTLCPDRPRQTIALLAAVFMLAWPGSWGQIGVILSGALCGLMFLRMDTVSGATTLPIPVHRRAAMIAIALFVLLLAGLPVLTAIFPHHTLDMIDRFYRAGSLVFGGGHVVLPLLQTASVAPGWVSKELFLAGYGAAQAVPGPLFTFSAYLGAVMKPAPNGWAGGLICLVSIFLPSLLLLVGILPFWERLRRIQSVRSALLGVNAAVVGLLGAVFYDTVWLNGILSPKDFMLALIAFGLLSSWKAPPWVVVLATALGSAALSAI